MLLAFGVVLYKAKNEIGQLNRTLQMFRKAKAMDEREIIQLKEKINTLDEHLIQTQQTFETMIKKLEQENQILRGQQ